MTQANLYSGYIRVRVGGLYLEQDKLLLVKISSPISGEEIWIPPGGGVEFKESLEDALVREFDEETSLKIQVHDLRFTTEIIQDDFHVIEFFFDVSKLNGEVTLGFDPEHSLDQQLISEIGFFSRQEMKNMNVVPKFLKKEFWEPNKNELFFRNR